MTSLIFTRYLYIKTEVEHSLKYAILTQDKNSALFWAYELYYSGFKVETLALLSDIYNNYYSHYINLGKFLNKKCREYADNIDKNSLDKNSLDKNSLDKNSHDYIIGTIVKNLCIKRYSEVGQDRKVFIIFDYIDIKKYQTILETDYSHPRLVLQNKCEYTPWREPIIVNDAITIPLPILYENIKEKYYDHWLYYASLSPIWLNRIKKWNGIQNHKTQYIEFTDDFYFEQFYQLYNYEPDEQSNIIENRNIPI
jgi:hypothetical protein